MLWIIPLTAAVVAAAAIGLHLNALRFGVRVGREVQALWPPQPLAAVPESCSSTPLPAPVQRYLQKAIAPGRRAVTTVELRHGGSFRPKLDGGWLLIQGSQYLCAEPPAFVWWGRVRIAPGVWIDARDRFEHGHGNMLVMMDSTITLADRSGPDIDQGALLRWLAELVWLPTALRGPRVAWKSIDDRHAEARVRAGDVEVTGTFEFGPDDLPVRFDALRYRDLGKGKSARTEFRGAMSDYRLIDGLLVPYRMVAAWKVDGELVPYARFEVEHLVYDRARPAS